MTIDKAIEILSAAAHDHSMTFNPDYYTALAMGTHALNLIRQARLRGNWLSPARLHGEEGEALHA